MNLEEFSLDYLNILKTDFSGINLTRILDDNEFYNKQILDSIAPFEQIKMFKDELCNSEVCIDIGFGGGFPLLPLALINPHKKFLGLEARNKKSLAVQKIANLLKITNVKTFHQRVESIEFDSEAFITLKAVGKTQDFLPKINCTKRVIVAFYKGPSFEQEDEINNIPKGWKFLGAKPVFVMNEITRYILFFEFVPHGTNSKKILKKISTLL
ncbi:MAG: class I SAM-dependent methyltransferase [Halobacteriovoraceae bacterium]|nr:class I SAM-dependent methyltransferase [Halobacteriovoraceae bacterium]